MLRLTGAVPDLAAGEARIAQVLDDGRALAKFRQLVAAHGGDPAVCDDPEAVLPRAKVVQPLLAWEGGVVASMDALQVGMAAVHLGAGRNRAEDHVDPSVGFVLAKKPGDYVEVMGMVVAAIHRDAKGRCLRAMRDED